MALQAKQGYVGFVKLIPKTGGLGTAITLRVNSADIKLTQDITYPEVVDNKVDTTVYQLGPQVVGGNVTFPLIHEGSALTLPAGKTGSDCIASTESLASTLWNIASARNELGRMSNTFDCVVRYADNLAYEYGGCLINTMTWTINQSEAVSVTAEIIGGATESVGKSPVLRKRWNTPAENLTKFLSPARIITWNDARFGFWYNGESDLSANSCIIDPSEVRSFTCTLNNGIDRFYTMNNRLGPQDIAAKKREISGDITIMGHDDLLSRYTETNENRFTSEAGIAFGYALGANSTSAYWATGLYGVVFKIEEVALATGLFESKTSYRALGDCGQSFTATKLGANNVNLISDPSVPSGVNVLPKPGNTNYGTSTHPLYPGFY